MTRPMVSENVYDVAAGAPKQLPVSPHSEQVAVKKWGGVNGNIIEIVQSLSGNLHV